MKPLRVGVIGVGRMGFHHCRIYSSLHQVDFAGVFDVDHRAARKVSDHYHVPISSTIDELLEEVDAVSVATPAISHYELVMQCIANGVHVLVEKPFTETLEEGEELTRIAEASGLVVLVGHIERFNPTYIELKNVLEDMSLLAINFRRLSPYQGSNTDVDVVQDLMIHDLDLVLDLIHEEPISINATGLKVFNENLDHAIAQLSFTSNPMVTLTASRVTEQKIRAIDVTARGAYVETDLLNKSISVHRRSVGEYLNQNYGNVKYHQESIVERILVPPIEPLFGEIEYFVNCVVEQKAPCVSARDGTEALRWVHEIRKTIDQNAGIPLNTTNPVNR